ncbi:general transcription factor II-I repeat domain-containing protein 2 [Trichonephila clavipes]|nr:general transcription factor II-I repeat domain-containing protein 2 [Trichonephila clavipes]
MLSHLIASRSKTFTEGGFISECLIKAAGVLCPAQIKKIENVSLSRNAVASRVDEIAENLRDQHHSTILTFQAYSIAIAEKYAHQIKLLEIEFDRRFSDFKSCELQFRLFTSPQSIDIELVDENLQMELIEVQWDSLLKQKCMVLGIPDVYTDLSIDRFPKMLSFVTRIRAMFGTTYLC